MAVDFCKDSNNISFAARAALNYLVFNAFLERESVNFADSPHGR
jgi:hypothetical protein